TPRTRPAVVATSFVRGSPRTSCAHSGPAHPSTRTPAVASVLKPRNVRRSTCIMACSSFEGDGKNGAYCDMAEDTCLEHPEFRLAADCLWRESAETAEGIPRSGLPRRA